MKSEKRKRKREREQGCARALCLCIRKQLIKTNKKSKKIDNTDVRLMDVA